MCMEQLLVINRRSLTRVKEGIYHQYSMHLPQVPLVTAWGGEERGGGWILLTCMCGCLLIRIIMVNGAFQQIALVSNDLTVSLCSSMSGGASSNPPNPLP